MTKLRFKPSLKDTLRANDRAIRGLALLSGRDVPPELLNNVPDAKPRTAPRDLEGPVVKAISELLAIHPKILFATRQNSGAAGEFSHIKFYRILTHGKEITITDFWGILHDGRPFACEAKAPGFKEPRTDREFAQANFLSMVRNAGGVALFATNAQQVADALK